jgi:hypothetical protein
MEEEFRVNLSEILLSEMWESGKNKIESRVI